MLWGAALLQAVEQAVGQAVQGVVWGVVWGGVWGAEIPRLTVAVLTVRRGRHQRW